MLRRSPHEHDRWDDADEAMEGFMPEQVSALMQALRRSEIERVRLAVLNASLLEVNRRLVALATTDEKTGLPNYRRFEERLKEELARHGRNGKPLAILLLDVDRFKHYNDAYGHPAGDEALRIVARLIQQCIRSMDLAARYGGEEFGVILPDTDANAALCVAERIRAAVATCLFPFCPITISVGVSDLSIAGEDAEALIASADAALYAAKNTGRNRSVIGSRF